jgi:hypothetical protein
MDRQDALLVPVEKWKMDGYPDRDDRDGEPASDRFRLSYLMPNGDVGFKVLRWTEPDPVTKQPVTVERRGDPRRFDVSGGGGVEKVVRGVKKVVEMRPMVSMIAPQDIRVAEREIQGKPTIVRMGLWHRPEFSPEGEQIGWVAVDRKKVNTPIYWRDVTDIYYEKWRPAAYKDVADPYKGQKRPYTRIQELELQAEELRKQAETLELQNAELAKNLKASKKSGNS